MKRLRGLPVRGLAVLAAVLLLAAAILGGHWILKLHERDEALRLARDGRLAEAEPLLARALERDGDDVEVLAALARVKLAGADPSSAEEHLTRWADLRPTDTEPLRLRMNLRLRMARSRWSPADRLRMLGTAIEDGRRILELEPERDEVNRELARNLVEAGRFVEAEAAARRSLARAPADPELLFLIASSCHSQGRRSEAAAALDSLPPQARAQPEALVLRAILHHEAGEPERAIPLLHQTLALKGSPRRECLYRLGLALAAAGRDAEARKVMAELDLASMEDAIANDHFPETPALRVQVAEAMLAAGRSEEARTRLEKVLAEAPEFPAAHRVLARYYEEAGDPGRAAEHRRKSAGGMR